MNAAPAPLLPFSALVIDDDEFVRGVLAQQLRTLGAQDVYSADSGHAARARLDGGEPVRLIVCDLMMRAWTASSSCATSPAPAPMPP